MRRRIALGVAGIALVAGAFWWFDRNFEAVVERVWIGFRGEAARDQFLAAEQFLARMGVEVSLGRSYTRLRDLPQNSVAILPAGRQSLVKEDVDALIAWVRGGGHLIVQPERIGLEDSLLAHVGMENREAPGRTRKASGRTPLEERAAGPITADSEDEVAGGASCRSAERLGDVKLPGAAEPVIVRFAPRSGLRIGKETPDYLWGDRGGIHIASVREGKGRLTALSSFPFINHTIEAHDHAALLYHLVRWDGHTGVVRFFDHGKRISIWQWSIERAPYFLIALATLIALWLWRTAARFGPIAPDPLPVRRRLIDHLAASGRFQWRHGSTRDLARAAREQAFEQLRRVSPGFGALDHSRQLARLQQLVGLSMDEGRAVLQANPHSAAELLHQLRLYQRIHAALRRGPSEPLHEAIV